MSKMHYFLTRNFAQYEPRLLCSEVRLKPDGKDVQESRFYYICYHAGFYINTSSKLINCPFYCQVVVRLQKEFSVGYTLFKNYSQNHGPSLGLSRIPDPH